MVFVKHDAPTHTPAYLLLWYARKMKRVYMYKLGDFKMSLLYQDGKLKLNYI